MKYIIKRVINLILVITQYSPFALIWMLKAFVINWPLSKWSFLKLPGKANEMGLRYFESDYIKEFGIIKGKINGFLIEIKASESMNSTVRIITNSKKDNFEISLYKSSLRTGKNVSEFKTGNWKFNQTFKTKRANNNLIQLLSGQNELYNQLVEFYTKWIFKLDALFIDQDEICCKFKYGFYFFPYIPVWKIEKIVNQLVAIAGNYDNF